MWHLVLSKPRQERIAAINLERQGFQVFLPMIGREIFRQGSLERVEEPLFKRYLFVNFDQNTSPWHVIRNTKGVSELIRFGSVMATVPDEVIEALKNHDRPTSQIFTQGDILKVTEGPFKDLEVVYQLRDGNQRAIVLIEMLNKIQKIKVDIQSLKKS